MDGSGVSGWVVEAAVEGFEAVLREQIAAARRELAAAREVCDYDGVRSYGLRLTYLLQIAEENRVELAEGDMPSEAPRAEQAGG